MMAYNSWGGNMMAWTMDGVMGQRLGHSRVVLGVLGFSLIGDVSNVSVIPVDVVIDVLDPD